MSGKYPKLIRDVSSGTMDIMFLVDGAARGEAFSSALPYLQSNVDHFGDSMPGVRVMKTSPESMEVQIRTYGPVGTSHKGKRRPVYSSFSYGRQGMLKLAEEITRIAMTIEDC